MKRTEAKRVGEIIDTLMLEESGNRDEVLGRRASFLWEEIVGAGVNRYTTKRYVKNGVLHVYLTSAVLKNELSFHRATLVKQINDAVGETVLTAIEFH